MNAIDFVNKVRDMRAAQKTYFKTRLQGDLIKSKQLEADVDKALKEGVTVYATATLEETEGEQIGMFDANGNDISPTKQWGWNDDIAVCNELREMGELDAGDLA